MTFCFQLTYDQVPISKQAFKQLLIIMYTGKSSNISPADSLEIVQTAGMKVVAFRSYFAPEYLGLTDQYSELLEYLDDYVYTAIDVSNCLGLLQVSHKFGHKELKEVCLEFIVINQFKVLSQNEWKQLEDKLRLEVFSLLYEREHPWWKPPSDWREQRKDSSSVGKSESSD